MGAIGLVVHPARPAARELALQTIAWAAEHGHTVRLDTEEANALGRPELGADGPALARRPRSRRLLRWRRDDAPHGRPRRRRRRSGPRRERRASSATSPRSSRTGSRTRWSRSSTVDFLVEERMLVGTRVELTGDRPDVPETEALNEIVIEKTPTVHTVRLAVSLDGEFFTTYAADGLIVATPTGSTAYSFSARGPIVAPGHRALIMTPVSPHMLFDRALVLEPSTEVRIVVLGPRPAMLSADGRAIATLTEGDAVVCTGSEHIARLVRFDGERLPPGPQVQVRAQRPVSAPTVLTELAVARPRRGRRAPARAGAGPHGGHRRDRCRQDADRRCHRAAHRRPGRGLPGSVGRGPGSGRRAVRRPRRARGRAASAWCRRRGGPGRTSTARWRRPPPCPSAAPASSTSTAQHAQQSLLTAAGQRRALDHFARIDLGPLLAARARGTSDPPFAARARRRRCDPGARGRGARLPAGRARRGRRGRPCRGRSPRRRTGRVERRGRTPRAGGIGVGGAHRRARCARLGRCGGDRPGRPGPLHGRARPPRGRCRRAGRRRRASCATAPRRSSTTPNGSTPYGSDANSSRPCSASTATEPSPV